VYPIKDLLDFEVQIVSIFSDETNVRAFEEQI
jgi:hypothetical protein